MDEPETADQIEGEALPTIEHGIDSGEIPEPISEHPGTADEPTEAIKAHEGAEEEQFDIERDGKVARIPTWLKPELMMQADYARKTQELADARRALEAERTTTQHASDAEISAQANLSLIDAQIAHFAKVDWNVWHDSDAAAAQKSFFQFQLLKDARQQTANFLGSVRYERAAREAQEANKRREDCAAELARDIKDWSPTTATTLIEFGHREYGLARQDLDAIDDPRLIKVLHAAFQWEEHQKKQRQAQMHAAAQTAKPAATVGGGPPKPGLDDRLTPDEWLRRRNEQLRKRG